MVTSESLEFLLRTPARIHVACTGGGAGLQKVLWEIPGISKKFSGATFPYSVEEQTRFLGFTPKGSVNIKTAVHLAMRAYYEAYLPGGEPAIGIGLTASTASVAEHRGDHRVFAASFTDRGCRIYHTILKKGVGKASRIIDGEVCDNLAATALIEAFEEDVTHCESYPAYQGDTQADLCLQEYPFWGSDGTRQAEFPWKKYRQRGGILAGSFNPPHEGHFGIANSFVDYVGGPVCFSIECHHPVKGSILVSDFLRRAKQLQGWDVMLTRGCSLYREKAKFFKGVGQVMGADAFLKILDPKWTPSMPELVADFQANNTPVYVVDRLVAGKLVSLDHLRVPSGLSCHKVPGRWDISSADIRKSQGEPK